MTTDLSPLLDDLAAEHAALDSVVAGIALADWDLDTPAAGWRVRDQIGHLTFYDRAATKAIVDPDGFVAWRDETMARAREYVAESESIGREQTGDELLATWREGRDALLAALAPLDPKARLVWYGPTMSARSFATARLMETWAHGQDVVDALDRAERPATDRLRHIAHLGVVTRGWSYAVRGREAPAGDVRVELAPPSGGESWAWGESSADSVSGEALDFCLVVTQRRNVADTGLTIVGPLATEWMAIAQAFAGPPGEGRPPAA
jgi:uncharacterized protein (TIGR03084 family)